MSEAARETSHCPICENLLKLDEDGGYFCPYCGWDESSDPQADEVWIMTNHDDKEQDTD